CKQYNSLPYSF
nr:immunoglobulin light chain junction region [Macaca mulatta]